MSRHNSCCTSRLIQGYSGLLERVLKRWEVSSALAKPEKTAERFLQHWYAWACQQSLSLKFWLPGQSQVSCPSGGALWLLACLFTLSCWHVCWYSLLIRQEIFLRLAINGFASQSLSCNVIVVHCRQPPNIQTRMRLCLILIQKKKATQQRHCRIANKQCWGISALPEGRKRYGDIRIDYSRCTLLLKPLLFS